MPCDPNTTVLHRLEDGYHITVIPGRPHTLFLRDRYCTKLAILELFQDRIVRVSGYRVRELPRKHAEVLIDFVRGFHYFLSPEAALELGLSVIRFEDGGERYFTVSELSPYRLNKIMRSSPTPPECRSAAVRPHRQPEFWGCRFVLAWCSSSLSFQFHTV